MAEGAVADGWGRVADAFTDVLDDFGDVGAQLCVRRHGELVVDLAGGRRSVGISAPCRAEDLYVLASVTKGVTAIALGVALQQKCLDPAAPVVELWPEFGAAGKHEVTVEQVLSHQAGLVTVEPRLSVDEMLCWDKPVAALAAMEPCWPLDGRHGYHPLTWGWLAGEVLRRATGRDVSAFVDEELAAPLGIDLWIGAPPDIEARLNPLIEPPPPTGRDLERVVALFEPGSLSARAMTLSGTFTEPVDGEFVFNSPRFHAVAQPAGNGISNARSLAKLFAACLDPIDGVRLLDDDTLTECMRPRAVGRDEVVGIDSTIGLGTLLSCELHPMLGPGSFGHPGSAGSLAFADRPTGIAFAYVTGTWQTLVPGPEARQLHLIEAVRAALR